MLRFTRLPSKAYDAVARAVDEDDAFRARVAAAADERDAAARAGDRQPDEVAEDERDRDGAGGADGSSVGRVGWLWLHRPDGWASDPALAGAEEASATGRGAARLRRERDGAQAAAARHRRSAEAADAARRRAVDQLAEVRRGADGAHGELLGLRHRVSSLVDERNRAIRSQKAVEADLATARRDLRAVRETVVQAEADLAERTRQLAQATGAGSAGVRLAGGPPAAAVEVRSDAGRLSGDIVTADGTGDVDASPLRRPPERAAADGFDGQRAQRAVEAASQAAELLARALADAAGALAPTERPPAEVPSAGAPTGSPAVDAASGRPEVPPAGRRGAGAAERSGQRRARTRARPYLPPGVFEGSTEAHRHLVSVGEAQVLVDGYNLARTAWSGLEPQEERRRTVALLEEVGARSGAPVTVVFDGADATVAPVASRSVRVRFSATGRTADQAIANLLATLPASEPVMVVSSDREVADDARRQGAVALSSRDFLTAAGR